MRSKDEAVRFVDVSTYLLENRVPAGVVRAVALEDDGLLDSLMFAPPEYRHHSAVDESNVDMIVRATDGLVHVTGAAYSTTWTSC